MRATPLVFVAAMVVPLAGCSDRRPTLAERFSRLELDMGQEQVVSVMGDGGTHLKGPGYQEVTYQVATEGGRKPLPEVDDYILWGLNGPHVLVGPHRGKLAFAVLVDGDDHRRLGP